MTAAPAQSRSHPQTPADTMPVTILYEDQSPKSARYVARVEGIADEAELTITKISESLISADHTGVPNTMRGLGIAPALAQRLIDDARAKGQRIVPICPYVRAYATKHKEATADVIQW